MSLIRIGALLRSPRRAFSREEGFSLIEVLASLFIFTLLTLGLVPLLTSSIRGSNTARADTIGKNAALKAMERVRGLPYHVSYATSTTKVDVLDLYYPSAATDIVAGTPARTMYRTVCAWNALTDPACPRDVPSNYTITFEAEFVDAVVTGVQPTPGETATSYANVPPAATYAWNSSSTDTPPRQILQMTVTASWVVGNSNESYSLTSLVTDRSFGGRKLKGTASVGYGLDFYTFYDTKKNVQGAGVQSSSNIFVVRSDSDIEGRRLSSAIQNTTAARAELEREAGGSLGVIDAATSTVLRAPPDQNAANVVATSRSLLHSDFANANITAVGPSAVSGLTALASGAAPSATGDSEITGVVSGTDDYVSMKDPQLNNADYNALNLSTAGTGGPSIANVERINGLSGPLPGISAPITTGLAVVGGSRAQTLANSVHTQATTGFDRLLLLKSNWIPDPAPIFGGGTLSGAEGAIIVIEDFQAAVTCDSNTNGTGTGDARYQATVYYWADPTQNANRDDASYRRITLNVSPTTAGADPLAAVMAENSNNGPLVYDHASGNNRIYLFGKTLGQTIEGNTRTGRKAAYLTSWSSLTTTASRVTTATDAAGAPVASVNSSVDGAIEIETADYDTTNQVDAIMAFSMGSLSCFAEDAR